MNFTFTSKSLEKTLVFKIFTHGCFQKKHYIPNHVNINTGMERDYLEQNPKRRHLNKKRDHPLITAVAFGGFFILIGLVLALNPNIFQEISAFFNNFTMAKYPFSGGSISLLAPADPAAHSTLYAALIQFDIGIGILQVILLALRVLFHSNVGRLAETVGNIVFWFGAAFLVNTFLLGGTLQGWFQYWSALIVLVGVSLVARAMVHLVKQ